MSSTSDTKTRWGIRIFIGMLCLGLVAFLLTYVLSRSRQMLIGAIVTGSLLLVVGGALWFMRKGRGEVGSPSVVSGSIRLRLALSFALFALLPGLMAAGASVIFGLRGSEHSILIGLDAAVDARAARLEAWQDSLRRDVAVLRDLDADNLHKLLAEAPASGDAGSQEFQYTYVIQRSRFQDALKTQGNLDVIFLINTNGEVVLSTDVLDESVNVSGASYVTQLLQPDSAQPNAQADLQHVYVGPPTHSVLLDGPAVTVAAPVLGEDGQLLGILAAQAAIGRMQSALVDRALTGSALADDGRPRLALAGLSATGETYLVDDKGRLLAGTLVRSNSAEIGSGATGGAGFVPVQQPLSSEGIDNLLASHRDSSGRFTDFRGDPVLGVYRWLPDLGVGIVAEAGTAQVAHAMLSMVQYILLITAVVALAAIGGSLLVARRIVHPLSQMAQAAMVIAAGASSGNGVSAGDRDLSISLPVERDDEIGQTAVALNRMTQRLREVVSDLEARVRARTTDLERRSEQLQAAARVSRRAASIHDVDELLWAVADHLGAEFGFYHVGIYLLDPATQVAVLRAASGAGGDELVAQGFRLKLDAGEGADMPDTIARTASSGQAGVVSDARIDPRYFAVPELSQALSEICLPLRVREFVIGFLDIRSASPGAFSEDDVAYLQTMTDQIGLAIDNARLLEQAEQRLQEIERLLRVQRHEGWQQMMSDRTARTSQPNWAYAYNGLEILPGDTTSPSGEPLALDPDVVLPIGDAEDRVGSIKVQLRRRHELSRDEMRLAEAIVTEASRALERARLFQGTQDALLSASVLYQCSRAIVASESMDEVLLAITDHVVTSEIDRVLIMLREHTAADEELGLLSPSLELGEARRLALVGEPYLRVAAIWQRVPAPSRLVGESWPADVAPAIADLATGNLALGDIAESDEVDSASREFLLETLGIRSVLVTPLLSGQQILGWLLVGSAASAYTFVEREVRLYEGLAGQVATMVRNFQLLELATERAGRERQIADVGARIRRSTDVETILQTSVRELARILRARDGVIRLQSSRNAPTDANAGESYASEPRGEESSASQTGVDADE